MDSLRFGRLRRSLTTGVWWALTQAQFSRRKGRGLSKACRLHFIASSIKRGQRSTINFPRLLAWVIGRHLEFLIKDYLISKTDDPTRHEHIKRKMLGACISDYVTDNRIKAVAERAAWLGNDEAHYVRRWDEHDIADLKRLIDLTVKWIEMELETGEALASMPRA
jgi:hypothetical protein